jgi:UDP:flavonoid glycosyltransferase YjiC (YdhE family)
MQTSPIEVQKALKDMDYPANKEKLIEHAKKHKASKEVMEVLEELPDQEYSNAADVSREFSGK